MRSAQPLPLAEWRVAPLGLLLCAGCFGTESTPFPPGLEPWDPVNLAPAPADGSESLTFERLEFQSPIIDDEVDSVHARAFIQRPMGEVWAAVLDPQTVRDPVETVGFRVDGYDVNPDYDFSYRTWHRVENIVNLEWEVEWRLGVVEGTEESPSIVAVRWQKVEGTTAFAVLEGSLVLQESGPAVTEVRYQYHLDAPLSGYETIEDYLSVIYGRLVARSHDRPLEPDDCPMCAEAPPHYLR